MSWNTFDGEPSPESLLGRVLDRLTFYSRQVVMGTAFVLPLIIIGALFFLARNFLIDEPAASPTESVTPSVSAITPTTSTTPDQGQWPDGLTFTAHTVPALIKDMIPVAGTHVGYSFSGPVGTSWRITVEALDGGFDPQVTVYAPSGVLFASNDDWVAGSTTAEIALTLPEPGTYRVVVSSSATNPTEGSYRLALFEE